MNRLVVLILSLFILSQCSLNENSRIWKYTEKEIDNNKNIKKIDLLKIDTEGYEFNVLKGASLILKKIKLVYFEHHYDDMIIKNYKFGDIHNLLKKKKFKMIKKSKMIFRKSFEYVYENQKMI